MTGSTGEYGLLCGGFADGQALVRISSATAELRNLPFKLYDGAAATIQLSPFGGASLAIGNPLPASYTGPNQGLWAGRDSDGIYKVRIGTPGGNRLTWDGNALAIVGNGSGITNINGGNITAGTITAAQLNITAHPGGAALNADPNTSDPSMWVTSGNPAFTPAVITTITDGVVGTTSLRSRPGTQAAMSQPVTPIDVHKTYRVHAWARSGGGATSPMSLRMNTFGGNNGYLGEIGLGVDNVTVPAAWTEYIGTIGPAQFPAATVTMCVEIYFNYPSPGAGYTEVQDVRIEEMLPSTLIKDGVITTNKIAAHTITAANILANSITVAEIDATGFGDNVIKNGTFEGMTLSQALAGWSPDPGAGPTVTQSCCGSKGPGTLYITPPAGSYTIIEYRAVPVTSGATYRVAMDSYNTLASATPGFWVRAFENNTSTPAVQFVRVSPCCLNPGDVANTHSTDISAASTSMPGNVWTHYEWIYTVPQGITWVSLAIQNWTCQVGPCASIHIDNVEMQLQIGAGHIRANSITADRLVANSITAAQIAGGTITGAQIAARTIISGNIATGTLGANEIAAGSLTADRLAARTITSGYIATGTITANELAATTITADKLNVSSLSAISANLGTVTAGTINGVTINGTTINGSTMHAGGGNEVTIDSSGLTLASGNGTANQIKWSSGGVIYGSSSTLTLRGGDVQIGANNGSMTYFFESNAFQGAAGLGTQSIPWTSFFVTPPTNNAAGGGSSFYPLQLNTTDNQMHRKTNGYDGQCVITAGKSLYIDHGIVVGCV
jgi:hypothetical protein